MTKRFTFLVCIACGVQSPPIVFDADDEPIEVNIVPPGWSLNHCPECLKIYEKETVKA